MISLIALLSWFGSFVVPPSTLPAADPPRLGDRAPDFTLSALDGTPVTLAAARRAGPVVLIVGRGWVGYQCPFCNQQFGDFLRNADAIAQAGARVIWVYPGPTPDIQKRAAEFAADRPLPSIFQVVLDPDYVLTLQYGVRWDAPRETAYPSTFVIDREGVVRYGLVSRTHGGRATAADVLTVLRGLTR
jgi:peroxiredoxin